MNNNFFLKLLIFISIILFSLSCDVLTKMNKTEWEEKNLEEEKEDIFFIYVAGYCSDVTDDDFLTIKYDENGLVHWIKRRNNMDNDQAFGLALDNSGNVYTGGMTNNIGAGTPSDYFLVKYDSMGHEIWSLIDDYSLTSWESITGIDCDENNNIYVTGYYFDPSAPALHDDFCTVKYESNSNRLWFEYFQEPVNEMIDDRGYGISCKRNDLFVTGISPQPGEAFFDICLIKYDLSGNNLNTTYYPDIIDAYDQYAKDIVIDKYGYIYVIGYVDLTGGNYNCILLKYDSSLNLQWDKIIDINTDDRGEGVVTDSAGNIYIAIHSGTGPGNFDCYTIKYDQLGNEIWRRQYGTNGIDDQLWDIAVDPKGNVYSVGNSNNNFLIIKYDFYGNQRWVRNFDNGGGYDQASAVAIGFK